MTEQLSEYQLFRLQKLHVSYDEDNKSAHFSNKQSAPDFTDRIQVNSARSSPNQICQSLRIQLFNQQKLCSQLQTENQGLKQQLRIIRNAYEELKHKSESNEAENIQLKNMLQIRLQKQRATKGKLKQWVAQAKQNLQG